jgi:hypothetical protein
MRAPLTIFASAGVLALCACGSTVETGTGGNASTSTSTSSGVGGSSTTSTSSSSSASSSSSGVGGAPGDCQSAADCGGKPCSPITPGGYQVCLDPVAEATSCNTMGPPNECCTSADCATGACYPASKLDFCGGAFPAFNVCIADECQQDGDCAAGEICAPAGAYGYPKRYCLKAYCRTNADCTAKPGGACVPIGFNQCCALQLPAGLACAYPGACAKDSDCLGGTCTIEPTQGIATCVPGGPGCPP